jgi:hypothetical protein
MITEKFTAQIGTADKRCGGLINAYGHVFADTLWQLKLKLKEFYKDTFWQEKLDDIAVYPIVTEDNGYQHCGKELFRVTSKRFWAKN